MRISWSETKSNAEVMEMTGYKRFLLKTISKRQPQFFGHINRVDGVEKQILSGQIRYKKSRGREGTKYTDSSNNFLTGKVSPYNEHNRKTDDRELWKAVIAYVCNRPSAVMMKTANLYPNLKGCD